MKTPVKGRWATKKKKFLMLYIFIIYYYAHG